MHKLLLFGVPARVQWVNDLACLCVGSGLIPSPLQWVKNPVLLQLWLKFDPRLGNFWHRSQLWLKCDPRLGNFHLPQVGPKKGKKKKKKVLHFCLSFYHSLFSY